MGVEKYKPNSPGAFDKLYSNQLKKRDKTCENIIRETRKILGLQ